MITNTIINFIKQILKEQDIEAKEIGYVGIASPGTIENNCIYNVVNLGLEKLDIAKYIKKEFNLEVKIKMMLNVQELQKVCMEVQNLLKIIYICV